jgi:putative membrane protein insertion efficiency factor
VNRDAADRGDIGEDNLGDAPVARVGLVGRIFLSSLRGYQLARAGHLSPCRFVPSCSEYAVEAITRYGSLRGVSLAARRLLRCHPFGGWGVDPVPR